jgi:hypothetical protein
LEVCRLHIWADHFDGKRDAKWFGGKDVFLWRGRGVGSRGVDHQSGADEAEKMKFVFHTRNESNQELRRLNSVNSCLTSCF